MTQKMDTGETPERYPACGAKTRKGTPCRLRAGYKTSHPGEGRCKFHGGASSGPPEEVRVHAGETLEVSGAFGDEPVVSKTETLCGYGVA